MLIQSVSANAIISLREITADTVRAICSLKVSPDQTAFVTANAISIAEAYFSKKAWFRAIYADDVPVGFMMLEEDPGIPDYFLWRFMIAAEYQQHGFGHKALSLIAAHVKTRPGATELITSVVQSEGGAQGFYEKFGFSLTGEFEEGEALMKLSL